MRLEHFQYIVEIAQCKSMSKASKKLFITQPSLSTAIQNLEEELGFQIFKRSASGVSLTDKGEQLLQIASEVTSSMEKVKCLTAADSEQPLSVNLAAVPVFCNALMVDLITAIKVSNPNVVMNIQELRTCKILPSIISGSADIGVGTYSPSSKEQILQDAAKHNIVIEPVFEDRMLCYLPRNHRLARKPYITLLDLKDDTPAYFQDHSLMDSYECIQMDPLDDENNKNYYSFTDRSSIKKVVSKGLAYATLPRLMTYDDIYVSSGMVIPVPLADVNVPLTNFIAYSAKNASDPAVKQTRKHITELYQAIDQKFKEADEKINLEVNAQHNSLLLY